MSGSISGLQSIAGDIAGAINNSPAGSSQSKNALQFLADLVAEMEGGGKSGSSGGGGCNGSGSGGGANGASGQGGVSDLVSQILQALEGGSSQSAGGGGGIGDPLGGLTSMLGGGGSSSSGGSGSSGGGDTLGQIGKIAGEVLPIAAMFL